MTQHGDGLDDGVRIATVRAERSYPVVVGRSLWSHLPAMVTGASTAVLVHPPALRDRIPMVTDLLANEGADVVAVEVPDGESAKSVDTMSMLWGACGQHRVTRSDVMISIGGGATTDAAGFAAATWLRGIRIVHLPTSLLAMVDAAVGGKTGINTVDGKNLVGSFYSPHGVLCDIDALETLAEGEFVSGLAEVAKIGLTLDSSVLRDILESPQECRDWRSDLVTDLVWRAVKAKADVVSADFKEEAPGGMLGREVLNYGHTLGHAIERVENYRWRHGFAISVGMVFVAELARLGGHLDQHAVDEHRRVLSQLGLPIEYAGADWEELLAAMRIDKKSRGDQLRFVVLDDLQKPRLWANPELSLLRGAFDLVSA